MTGRHRAERPRPGRRKRRRRTPPVVLATLAVTGAVVAGGSALTTGATSDTQAMAIDTADASPAPTTPPPSQPTPSRSPSTDRDRDRDRDRPRGEGSRSRNRANPPAAATSPVVVVPEAGSGSFDVVPGATPAVGSGQLVTYTVELEGGLPLTPIEVANVVDQTLADPRSWTATGAHAVQRVTSTHDIRVLIATPGTTDELCAPLDTGGRLSCRNGNLVVLNAWRWVNGAETYGKDLRNYRRYLINHEFGHALGNSHQYCAESSAPAPVMLQQTKALQGCSVNPWPTP